jgi:hypothetical protein
MYVKVVTHGGAEETLYECSGINVPAHRESAYLFSDDPNKYPPTEINVNPGDQVRIYAMNDNGKTIEHWVLIPADED